MKWYARLRARRANKAIRKVINNYESDYRKVVAIEKKAMRAMQRFHQQGRGWKDIGYHRVIFPSGHVYEGRPIGVQGAHCLNANHRTGYSFAGNFEVQEPTKQALDSFRLQLKIDEIDGFVGHFQVPGNSTACPGKNLKRIFKLT